MRLSSVSLLVLLHLLSLSYSASKSRRRARKHLKYEDCGSNPDRPIHILDIDVTDLPIVFPGRHKLSVALNITRELPEIIAMDVSVSKYVFGLPLKIPCHNNVGTCHYMDICAYLAQFDREGCPHQLEKRGLPCSCPFQPGVYSLRKLLIRIPKFEGLLAVLVKGEYTVTMRLYDESNRDELGCLSLKLKLKPKNRHKRQPKQRSKTKSRTDRHRKTQSQRRTSKVFMKEGT